MKANLKQSILSKLTYADVVKICQDYPTAFDCDWDLWREKAVADLNVSGEFFDLLRSRLSGAQRYLQIKSYYTLTPEMAVRVYEDGYIEGVYESLAAFRKLEYSKNYALKNFYAARLREPVKELLQIKGALKLPIPHVSQQEIERLNSAPINFDKHWKLFGDAVIGEFARGDTSEDFLFLVLDSGSVKYLDFILPVYFNLPQGFSIEEKIPYLPFWSKDFPIYDLPPYQGRISATSLLKKSVHGGNVKVIDFMRSILRDQLTPEKMHSMKNIIPGWIETSLNLGTSPEEAYSIIQRFSPYLSSKIGIMLEQVAQPKTEEQVSSFLIFNQGNIPCLLTCLPLLSRKEIEEYLLEIKDVFPLSQQIIELYLESS